MSEQPSKKEAGPSTDPTPPQTVHDTPDPEKVSPEVQETKGNQEKKKREYKEFTHDEEKATRMSHLLPPRFSRSLILIQLADHLYEPPHRCKGRHEHGQ